MVVAEAPLVAEGVEHISTSVAIDIPNPGNLGLLGDVEGSIPVTQAENLVETAGETMNPQFRPLVKGPADQQDLSPASADRQAPIGQQGKAPHLQRQLRRNWQIPDRVELFLRLRCPPDSAKTLSLKRRAETPTEKGQR